MHRYVFSDSKVALTDLEYYEGITEKFALKC